MDDCDVVARTLYGEARGEGLEGLEAVACVIMNRVKQRKWFTGYVWQNGEKIPSFAQTCLKKAQFSCWNKNDSNFKIINSITTKDKIFCCCVLIARKAVNGELVDFTNGATYYHCKNILPQWAVGKFPCYRHKNHLFYNDI